MSFRADVYIQSGTETPGDLGPIVGNENCRAERDCAVKNAWWAANDLIKDGVLGDPTKLSFRVHICGHMNPEHGRYTGTFPEYLQITIEQDRDPKSAPGGTLEGGRE